MPRRQNESRPAGIHRATRTDDEKVKDTLPASADTVLRRDRHAELALRIAWLRVHADLLYDVDRSGLLSAQLLDLADLLEALDGRGRVVW